MSWAFYKISHEEWMKRQAAKAAKKENKMSVKKRTTLDELGPEELYRRGKDVVPGSDLKVGETIVIDGWPILIIEGRPEEWAAYSREVAEDERLHIGLRQEREYGELKKAVSEFFALMERFEDFGAWDTEPRWIFTRFVGELIQNDVTVPTDWELFTESMDCREATAAMTATAWKIASLVKNNRTPEVIDFLEEVADI